MLHALPVAAAADGVFTVSDRTEARVRAPDPVTNAVALDLDTLMDARAVWRVQNTTLTLDDQPRFTLLDYNGPASEPALLDSVLASAEWHLPRVRIRVAESASYGQLSFESLTALPAPGAPQPTPSPTGQPTPLPNATLVPPTSKSLLYASSETSVGSTLQLRPWTIIGRVGYQLTGGANAAAQEVLPFQKGPFAEATADYRLDARNHLATLADGSETDFSLGTEDLLAEVEEQWRHQWARLTETMLAGGWYAARTRDGADAPDVFASNPVAEAAFDQRFARGSSTAELRADVRLAPYINRLTGLVDEQIRGTVEGSWARRRFKLRAFVSAGESVDQGTVNSTRLATAEIDGAYTISEALTVDGGVRGLYQEQSALGAVPAAGGPAPIVEGTLSQAVVFIALTVRAPKVKF